jgi:hypothetical protein
MLKFATVKLFIVLILLLLFCVLSQDIEDEPGNEIEDFFTITESENIIDGNLNKFKSFIAPDSENITNFEEYSDQEQSNGRLETIDTVSKINIFEKEDSPLLEDIQNNVTVSNRETIIELFKAQIKNDFGPIIIIAEKLGIKKLLKSLVLSLHKILFGAFSPMIIVALKMIKHFGNYLVNFSEETLNNLNFT